MNKFKYTYNKYIFMDKLYVRADPKHVGFNFSLEKSLQAKYRYDLIKRILIQNKDSNLYILDYLLDESVKYIQCIIDFESRILLAKSMYGENSVVFNKISINLGNNRIMRHDTLISVLTGVNIYLQREYGFKPEGLIPIGGIFSEESTKISDRKLVRDWSWYLVSGLYEIVEK